MLKVIGFLFALFLIVVPLSSAPAFTPRYGFTDQEREPEASLYYYDARYYDPLIGRFIQPDPLARDNAQALLENPQELNPYSYVTNNPLKYIDPEGEKRTDYHSSLETPQIGEPSGTYQSVQFYAGQGSVKPSQSQCVTGVQRLYQELFKIDIRYGLGAAVNYADLSSASQGAIAHYEQGGTMLPQENDIIAWAGGSSGIGHLGMISEVVYDSASGQGMVYTVEQNHRLGQEAFGYALKGKIGSDGQTHYYVDGFGSYSVKSWQRPADGRTAPAVSQSAPKPVPQPSPASRQPWYNKLWKSFKNIFSKHY